MISHTVSQLPLTGGMKSTRKEIKAVLLDLSFHQNSDIKTLLSHPLGDRTALAEYAQPRHVSLAYDGHCHLHLHMYVDCVS